MKRFNLILVACLLFGCHDFAFDCFGRPPVQNSNKGVAPNVYIGYTGEVVRCTNDDQCGAGFSCFKDLDSFAGICAQIDINSK